MCSCSCVYREIFRCSLQDAKEALSGEKARLGDLQRLLRMRQQSMIGQVAALYPVKVFHDLPHGRNLNSNTNGENPIISCLEQ